jgi:tRNA G10  N-methylase Trm11
MRYLFTLGHQPHISIAELQAIFEHEHISYITENITKEHLIIETAKSFDAQKLILKLGGTVQIGEYISRNNNPKQTIIDSLLHREGKIHFSISGNTTPKLALEIKKELKAEGRSVRYVETKNTATILHNNLVDKKSNFIIIGNDVFVTTAIQDIEDFSKRDYDRPGSDSMSGMLPPKLARIMINLSQTDTDATLLDPFCGSGTVLTEALSLGYSKLIGSDLSQKAINDTHKNVEWFINQQNNKTIEQYNNITIHLSDATTLASIIKPKSIDAIISEPYMGKPLRGSETKNQLEKQASELAELYIKSFEQFYKILKKNSSVIFIIPKFRYKDEWISIDCLPKIKELRFEIIPFNPEHTSLLYHRPKQFVGREIWKLKKV